ncbi:hypothetical protein Tco_0347959 [Tanacetum coccineum]
MNVGADVGMGGGASWSGGGRAREVVLSIQCEDGGDRGKGIWGGDEDMEIVVIVVGDIDAVWNSESGPWLVQVLGFGLVILVSYDMQGVVVVWPQTQSVSNGSGCSSVEVTVRVGEASSASWLILSNKSLHRMLWDPGT